MNGARGLSLVELLAVLGLLGVLLAMALPSLASWRDNAQYRQAARELAGVLRLAGSHAVSRNLETEVDIDFDRPRYRLKIGDRSSGSVAWTLLSDWKPLPATVRLAATLACDRVADGDPATVEYFSYQFNPNGSAGSSGTIFANYLCVLDGSGRPRFRLALVNKVTGRVTIKD